MGMIVYALKQNVHWRWMTGLWRDVTEVGGICGLLQESLKLKVLELDKTIVSVEM